MKNILSIIILSFLSINIAVAKEVLTFPVYAHIVEIDENIKQTQYEVDSNDKIISSSIKVVPYKTSITKEIIKKDFLELNKIWSKANIRFNLRDINFTKAETKNFKNYEELSFKNYNNINYINTSLEYHLEIIDHKKYDNINGINVYYIPKMLTSICGAYYSNDSVIFLGSEEEKLFDPNVKMYWKCKRLKTLAHEFGHVVQLDHSNIPGNLMMSTTIDEEFGKNLTKEQITEARKFMKKVLGLN